MPTINGAYTQGGVNSANLTLTDATDPGGSNKIRIMGAFARDTNVDPNTPGDWTDILFRDLINDTSIEFWYSTDSSPDRAIDPVATSSKEKGGVIIHLDDYDSGGSIRSVDAYNSSGTTHALGTLTSPGSDFVVIAGVAHHAGATATFDKNGETDFAEIHDSDIGSAGWHAGDVAIAVWTVTGNSGDYDCEDVVLSSADDCMTWAISIPISTGGGGVTVNITAATRTMTAQALTITPGAVTASPPAAVRTRSAQVITLTPGAVTVAPPAAIRTRSAPAAVITPGAATVTLTPASRTRSAQELVIDAGSGAITVNIIPAERTWSAQALAITPGEVTVPITAAERTMSAQPLTITPDAATVVITPAARTRSAQSITTTPGEVTVTLVAADRYRQLVAASIGDGSAPVISPQTNWTRTRGMVGGLMSLNGARSGGALD